MVTPRSSWDGRRVFITGHTGFKGGWLSLWMQQMGAEVLGYSLDPPTRPNLFEVARVGIGMRSIQGDVRDLRKMRATLSEFRPDVIFHLAAQSLVRPSYSDPVGTYSTNVMGTVNLLEAVRVYGNAGAVVIVTSDKCYENREWVWGYRETDPMGGRDPYSNSKGCAELVTAAYTKSYFSSGEVGTAVASARAGNVIGGGDWAEHRLVPDFIRAAVGKRAIRIRNPDAQRPWQHVLEPIGGYVLLAERLLGPDGRKYASGWNFGPRESDSIRVSLLIEKLAAGWGEGASYVVDGGENPHEATYLKLDYAKAQSRLGWHPRLRVDQALDWTVEWQKSHIAGADMRELTIDQIGRFAALQNPTQ